MTHEISDTQVATFRSHGSAVIEAYLESKGWQRNLGDGPRNIWYRQEAARDLCPYCDCGDDSLVNDPACPVHDRATWVLTWPCGDGATAHDVLRTLCRVEDREPEEVLHALTLRDRDEVRARCDTPLWRQTPDPDWGIEFFATLGRVLDLSAEQNTKRHQYTVGLVSENEVLFTFPHEESPSVDGPPSPGREAACRLYSTAQNEVEGPSDRSTHAATRYATGEWTTEAVISTEDLPPSTPLEAEVSSLVHQFSLMKWTLDRALPSRSAT
ncbi:MULTISPECIES: hypothetical protein [unclassified Streptomyces]|uniref:hypothetical protein n=1 Tax=unclassified Streptomyces TaxID=2593676 RepID=UPI001E4B60CD|nr:hypothetical protein [Streptomyces sp. CB02980]MCB8905787.1 hypothetical protein [Streptomyces sp. CB02980]